MFEKTRIKKNKKYNPPIHCEDERHNTRVGSRYLIFLKIEKPVPVIPEIASNKEFKTVLTIEQVIKIHEYISEKLYEIIN